MGGSGPGLFPNGDMSTVLTFYFEIFSHLEISRIIQGTPTYFLHRFFKFALSVVICLVSLSIYLSLIYLSINLFIYHLSYPSSFF